MARVTLIAEEAHPELADLIAHLKANRGGKLINLYRLLLNSPPLAAAWLDFNTAVRFRTELDAGIRELVILRVSILNGADYQLRVHGGAAYTAQAGLSAQQLAALANWRGSSLFAPLQQAVLAYTDAMTQNVDVPDEIYADIAQKLNERQIVELTVLIGAYNMHTRVSRALRLDIEPSAGK